MKTNLRSHRQRGNILLAIVALVALAGIVYVGYKLIERLQHWNPDPNHGQGTNALDTTMIGTLSNLTASYGPLHVALPEFNLTLPAEAMAQPWFTVTQTSSNMVDWEDADLDWEEVLELCRTNHTEPMRFWRRQLMW